MTKYRILERSVKTPSGHKEVMYRVQYKYWWWPWWIYEKRTIMYNVDWGPVHSIRNFDTFMAAEKFVAYVMDSKWSVIKEYKEI